MRSVRRRGRKEICTEQSALMHDKYTGSRPTKVQAKCRKTSASTSGSQASRRVVPSRESRFISRADDQFTEGSLNSHFAFALPLIVRPNAISAPWKGTERDLYSLSGLGSVDRGFASPCRRAALDVGDVTIVADRPEHPSPIPIRPSEAEHPRPRQRGRRWRRVRGTFRRISSEGGIVAILAFSIYITVGVLLDFHFNTFNGDAVSRMANGFYVLYSRDPHLASIGFVWNPGTSIADLVPLLFYPLWHPLASHMVAASLVSAACMAGAVYQLRAILAEWGVQRAPRLVLVAIFAVNGMIVYYGGNGMSEGLYLFTLVATSRYLLRWIRNDDLASLVYSATALGLCYLARNEAVAPAFLAGLVVLGISMLRRQGSWRRRIWLGLTDLTIFEIPFVTAFAGWAIVSFVITGQPFQQFTSVYGTTSQIKVAGSAAFKFRVLQDVHDIAALAPFLMALVVIAAIIAIRRRDFGVLAPLTVIGGGLSFTAVAYAHNSIQPWFRYFITSIPLEVILVGSFFATIPAALGPPRILHEEWTAGRKRAFALVASLLALMLLVPANVTTIEGMASNKIGFEETQHLGYIFFKHPSTYDKKAKYSYPAMQKLTDYLAGKHFADGQILVDNFSVCIPQVITESPNPDIFVIPNDRDFQRTLDDPLTFHAHYILDVDPTGDGALTAPNTTFPNLWTTGDSFAKIVHSFPAEGECPAFKLFKVYGHPNQNS